MCNSSKRWLFFRANASTTIDLRPGRLGGLSVGSMVLQAGRSANAPTDQITDRG
jgi:hypothetical protein